MRGDGERVVDVMLSMGHWESHHDPRLLSESLRGHDQHRVVVGHFFADVRAVLNEDNFGALWHPQWRLASDHQAKASAPAGPSAISSPPCFFGLKAASICSSVGSVSDSMTIRPGLTLTRTSVPSVTPAVFAIGFVRRNARPLPQALI